MGIRQQSPIAIETEISHVSFLARDGMKIPFRTPLLVRLGQTGSVDAGDTTLYSAVEPWSWNICQCLPSCAAEVADSLEELSRSFSGKLTRTLSGRAVKLVRSLSSQCRVTDEEAAK